MRLNDHMRLFIAIERACFRTPEDIQKRFHEMFGEQINQQQLRLNDPSSPGFMGREKFRDAFDAARAKFVADVSNIPVANAAFRLSEINDMYHLAKSTRNWKTCAALLEQAAKEMGVGLHRPGPVPGQRPAKDDSDISDEADRPPEVNRDMLVARLHDAVTSALANSQVDMDAQTTAH